MRMNRYREFYKDYKDGLFNYLMRMTGDYELSNDMMQESFTRYLEHYRDKPQGVSLLYAIARNALFDHLRKQKRQTQFNDGNEEDQSSDQEAAMMVRQEYQRVLSAMRHLGDTERDILMLVISGDLSYREIASITGTSVANVKVKVHRSRLKLKELLYKGGE